MRAIALAVAALALNAAPALALPEMPHFVLCTNPTVSRLYRIADNDFRYLYPPREGRAAYWSSNWCDDDYVECRIHAAENTFTYDYADEEEFEVIVFTFNDNNFRRRANYGADRDVSLTCRTILEPQL